MQTQIKPKSKDKIIVSKLNIIHTCIINQHLEGNKDQINIINMLRSVKNYLIFLLREKCIYFVFNGFKNVKILPYRS